MRRIRRSRLGSLPLRSFAGPWICAFLFTLLGVTASGSGSSAQTGAARHEAANLLDKMDEARHQDAEIVLTFGRHALELLAEEPDPRLEAAVLNRMANAFRHKGEHQIALDHAQRARVAAERGEASEERAQALFNIAIMHFSLADFTAARSFTAQSRAAFDELGDRSGVARVLNLEGVIERHRGEYDRALELLLDALEIEEELGDPGGIRRVLTNIGLVHWNLNQFDRALEIYSRSLELWQETDDQRGLATVLNNIGLCHAGLENHEEALVSYRRALAIRRKLNDRNGLALLHNNIGLVYSKQGAYDQALESFGKAVEIAEEIGRKEHAANTMNNIAEVYVKRGDWEEARAFAERSLAVSEGLPARKLMRNSHQLLSAAYEGLGDPRRALAHHRDYAELANLIFTEERDGRQAELEARFETESKEKDIEILKQKSAIKELELERQKMIRNALILGLLLILSWLILIYHRDRLRAAASAAIARQNELLSAANLEIEAQKQELEEALLQIHTLSGLLPICSHCKNIRDDDGRWHQLETYISGHSAAEFSHGLCPDCCEIHYAPYVDKLRSLSGG